MGGKIWLYCLRCPSAVRKTAFALNLALNAGIPVGFFSLEMSVASIRKRIMAMQTQIEPLTLHLPKWAISSLTHYGRNLNKLREPPLYVDDSSLIKVLISRLKPRMYKKHGVRMIIIDYLQLMAPKWKINAWATNLPRSVECKILAKGCKYQS